ncbi:hypothetical protein N9467_00005, partial [Litorivicinus sp.]|nr:hypothetical protein [Litorivicinus sp.]
MTQFFRLTRSTLISLTILGSSFAFSDAHTNEIENKTAAQIAVDVVSRFTSVFGSFFAESEVVS